MNQDNIFNKKYRDLQSEYKVSEMKDAIKRNEVNKVLEAQEHENKMINKANEIELKQVDEDY
jgi:hypothetical protein